MQANAPHLNPSKLVLDLHTLGERKADLTWNIYIHLYTSVILAVLPAY